jgi:tRNA threonylcarbamoyladenosine biosynthesis protein TsaE
MNDILIKDVVSIRDAACKFILCAGSRKVFAFRGKMGVGKTTFIKAVCEELGVKDVINSPTFAIINEYHSDMTGEPIYHFDFYRIETLAEARQIGTEDYFESGFLCFIEWPEKIEDLLPENTVFVDFAEQLDGSRELRIRN